MSNEDEIYALARRAAQGDLTPVQFIWWANKLGVHPREVVAIHKKRLKEENKKFLREIALMFALLFVGLGLVQIITN